MADDSPVGTGGGGSTRTSGFWILDGISRQAIKDALLEDHKQKYVTGASGLLAWAALAKDTVASFIAVVVYGALSTFGAFVNANLDLVAGVRETAVNFVLALLGSQQLAISDAFAAAEATLQSAGIGAWLLVVVELAGLAYITARGVDYVRRVLWGGSDG